MNRVTIADVARLAGVHKGTVSRALNESTRSSVKPDTVKRIQRAVKQLGYVPNAMARGLRTNLSMSVGVIIPDLTNPFFPPIVRGIEDFLAPRGYTALLANTDGRDDVERTAFTSLLDRRVDGLVIGTGHDDHPLLSEAFDQGVYAVLVNRGAGAVPYPLVTGNDLEGVVAAVNHLVALGHREIVHIAGPLNLSTSRVRSDAFTWACAQAGIECRIVETHDPKLNVEAGMRVMSELIAEPDRSFTAVVAGNDQLAVGVMRTLRQNGISCPGEVSVVGFNDMPFADDLSPSLTTVHVPLHDFGIEAARLLLNNIQNKSQGPVTVSLPVSLVVRGSTGPAPR